MKKVLFLMIAASLGCGDDSSGSSATRELFEVFEERSELTCECNFLDVGYATEDECRAERVSTPEQLDCLIEVFQPVVAYNPEFARCFAAAARESNDCLARAGCGATAEEVRACTDSLEGACADDNESLCGDLAGPERVECDAAEERAYELQETCFSE